MTEKMTLSADHFTPEDGFVEGVAIEIQTTNMTRRLAFTYMGVDSDRTFPRLLLVGAEFDIDQITYISILSGPMRFWGGAIQSANWCLENKKTGQIIFDYESGIHLDLERDNDFVTVTRRPWWCDFGKGE